MIDVYSFQELLELLEHTPEGLIGIEGCSTSGKTTLSQRLSHELSLKRCCTDDYRVTSDNPSTYYSNRIDASRLDNEIDSTGIRIVEGICLRDTIKRLVHEVHTYIYVKKVHPKSKFWYDETRLESGNHESNNAPGHHRCDLLYHRTVVPQSLADIVYCRSDI